MTTFRKLPLTAARVCGRVIRDIRMGLPLGTLPTHENAGLTFRGLRRADIPLLERMYVEISGAHRLPRNLMLVYWLLGGRMVLIAAEDIPHTNRLIGMNMYYFNARDVREHTIHEGFVGVAPAWRGQGVATRMRSVAAASFRGDGVTGVSSRVDVDNAASLKSAINAGFKIVEQYRDAALGVDRYYLVNAFQLPTGAVG